MSKFFELLTESVGWLQIVASPFLIGICIGSFIYFPNQTTTRLVIGLIAAALGLVIGVICATKARKGKGTIWTISRVMATPELDEPNDENNRPKIN